MPRQLFIAVLLLSSFMLGLCPRSADAHQSSVVYSALSVEGRALRYTFQVASADLYESLGLERDRPATRAEAEAGAARVTAYLLGKVSVKNHGAPCAAEAGPHRLLDRSGESGFFFVQEATFQCARSIEDLVVTYDLFFEIDPRHQGLARVTVGANESEQVFRERSRTLSLARPLSPWDHAADYLELGIEHIFTGYDHLAFLFCLLLLAATLGQRTPAGARPRGPEPTADVAGGRRARVPLGLRHVIGVVSAFTLAHSVTLVLSALRVLSLPGRLVETAIAVSIGYVALENLWRPRVVSQGRSHRFLLTFAFGLIHGFGFASVLREIGLPERGLLLSLFSFNVGVEIGQLLVVSLAFPVLRLLALASPASPGQRGRLPLRHAALIFVLCAVALGLFARFSIPWAYLLVVVVALPLCLLPLVPLFGYDRCVRVAGSVLLLLLSLLWTVERVAGASLLRGALG